MGIVTDYAVSLFLQGEYAQVERRSSELFALGQRCQNPQFVACALTFLGALALVRGQFSKAAALLGEADGQARLQPAILIALLISGHQALAALRGDDRAAAQKHADATLQHIRSIPLPNFVLGSYSHLTEVYLELWERSAMLTVAERRRLVATLKQALAKLHQHARAAVVAQPSAALWQGRFELRRGRPAVALRHLHTALQLAQKLAQPLDEALAHYWLARVILDSDLTVGTAKDAGEHLRAAQRLFKRLGAAWHGEQVANALRGLA
jgi:tetratricopeptide (TPR) repeat protein